MNTKKTLKDRMRRLAALLSLGVLFFSSCALADMIELRDADAGPAPYRETEAEVEEGPEHAAKPLPPPETDEPEQEPEA